MSPREREIEWLQAAQAGDPMAFEALYRSLYTPLWRFVARLTGHETSADDIVQTTLITLYRKLHDIDPPETLRAYVFRIARNRCIDQLRGEGRYDVEPLDPDTQTTVRVSFSSGTPAPDDAAHWMLLEMAVKDAIDTLPENQRQVLILFAEEHLSINEIALVLDVSPGTVKSRLHHARKTLRGRLHPETRAAVEEIFE